MAMMVGGNSGPLGGGNAAKYWDEETIVQEIGKNAFAKYIISDCKKNGKRYINIREWYHTQNNPTWLPAKAGCAIPVDNAIALNVITAMARALGLEVTPK
jgi:hypothetical protein